jgi:hypothetical protein
MQFHFSDANPSMARLFDYMCSVISLLNGQVLQNTGSTECVVRVLNDIANRPWFTRVWVVQGLALAKTATVRIGSYSFPWHPFESFMRWLPYHNVDPVAYPRLAEKAASIRRARRDLDFSSQLCRTLSLSATDPRDKLFSILGISRPSGAGLIIPDYTKSIRNVLIEATSAMLKDAKFAIYYYAPLQPLQDERPPSLPIQLPSWVPDLRITGANYTSRQRGRDPGVADTTNVYHRPITILPTLHPWLINMEHSLNQMSGRIPFCPAEFSLDWKRLHTPGVLSGTVTEKFHIKFDEFSEAELLSGLPKGLGLLYNQAFKPRGIDSRNVATLLSGVHPVVDVYGSAAVKEVFEPDPERVCTSRSLQRARKLCFDIKNNMQGKVIFMTDNTDYGLVYHPDHRDGIRVGDLLVGLFGINFPFILRKNNDGTYRIINVAGARNHQWGHDFLKTRREDLGTEKAAGQSWKDYEKYGLQEYVIV